MNIDVLESIPKEICIVAFAATQNVFQFGRVLNSLHLPHVLMRDSTMRWYQDGVSGIGNRAAVVDYMRGLMHRYHVKAVGASSGAYAALLYGQLARVDEIIAISPVTTMTFVDDVAPQWHHLLAPDHPFPIDDLRKFYEGVRHPQVKAFVSDGEGTVLDAHMARRIGIEPTLIPGHSHADLARHMRDTGLLATLLKDQGG